MSGIEWTENNLETLGRTFLRHVLDHMRNNEGAVVRLGETGIGVQPNYQVTFSNGVTRVLRGSSHKAYEQADEFDAEKISAPFSLTQIQCAFERA